MPHGVVMVIVVMVIARIMVMMMMMMMVTVEVTQGVGGVFLSAPRAGGVHTQTQYYTTNAHTTVTPL
jgi:hypothetical protein